MNTLSPTALAQINAQLEQEFPEVAKLDGEVEVAGVIDEDSAKTLTARSVILSKKMKQSILDAHGFTDFSFVNPIPVQSFDRRVVGFADVRWEGDVLVADTTLDHASPERLLIETEKVYAESTFRADGNIVLESLWLTTSKPMDPEETHLVIVK
jgi:hypothetical protein